MFGASPSNHKRNKSKNNKSLYSKLKTDDKRYNKERSTYLNIISENISVPADIIKNSPLITIHGRSGVYIENQKRVLEYTASCICIQTSLCILRIEGRGLKIAYCTDEEMKITGIINSIIYS